MLQRRSWSSYPTAIGPMIPPPPSAEQGRAVPERRVLRGGGWCLRVGPLLRPPPPRCWPPFALSPTGSLPLSSRCPALFPPATTPIGGTLRTAADATRCPHEPRTTGNVEATMREEMWRTELWPSRPPATAQGPVPRGTTNGREGATPTLGTTAFLPPDTYDGGLATLTANGTDAARSTLVPGTAPTTAGGPSARRPPLLDRTTFFAA